MKKTLLTGLLALSSILPAKAPGMASDYQVERANNFIQLEKKDQEMERYYDVTDSLIALSPHGYKAWNDETQKIEPLYEKCSRYALLVAKEYFGKNYSWSGAGVRHKNDELVYKFKSKNFDDEGKLSELDSLFNAGKLERGMMFALYNPNSNHKNEPGWGPIKNMVTHVGTFIGKTRDGKYYFWDNRGKYQGSSELSTLLSKGYDLRQIIDEKPLLADNKKEENSNDS